MRNPAAFTRFSVPAKIGCAFISVALLGSLGFSPALAESGSPVDLTPVREKAEPSDPEAQNSLGNAYSGGNGVAQDYEVALSWYRRAVEQGFAPAEFNLGLAYELGRGVTVDERRAFKYYMMAAEQGFGPAQFNVGNMYSAGRGVGRDLFEAGLWYKQAADKGIIEAQFNLGLAYEAGKGVTKDEAQAARWYRAAADRGFARAQYNLGLLLEEGRGGAKNETAAAALYRSAAEQGFASAQNNLGLMMAEGRGGLDKDPVQALVWLTLAVQNGARPAARDFVAQGLTPAQLAEVARLVDERRAGTLATSVAVATEKAPLNSGTALEAAGNSAENAGSASIGIPAVPAVARENTTQMEQQLDEANQALEKSSASVAELTAENDRLEKELKAARDSLPVAGSAGVAVAARRDPTELATLREERASLREENNRLRQAAVEAAELRLKNEQLTRENGRLTASLPSQPSSTRLPVQAGDPDASIQKLTATVAELTTANDALEKDLENAKKSTEAALAAQSQAVSAAQPDAYKMEISTLQAHVKELEGQVEEERNSTAKEIATMASQLQRTRDTNRSLTEANRALLASKENSPDVSSQEVDEMRRQNQRLSADLQKITTERDTARQVATGLSGLSDEKAALEHQLEGLGAQLAKAQADLATQQALVAESEKAADSHNTSVAELTQANTKLDQEKAEMRRLLESSRTDVMRLTQNLQSAEQLRADAERSGQQNIDTATAQLVQLRREVENARVGQARIAEAASAQERERASQIAQLRQENSALMARLKQAQGTLDQIAATARLGTPASAIASGSSVPVRQSPAASSGEPVARYHTVAEGDSLSRISMRYYGTTNRWQEVFQANHDVLQGSSSLRVGMQLRIP